MSGIDELLLQMLQARYGKDVRQSIHDSIEMCYDEATGKIQKELINSITVNADRAQSAAADADTSATTAAKKAAEAAEYAIGDTESAKYYYNQTRDVSQSVTGALKPMGTVSFANIQELESVEAGAMYNVLDEFITTEEFKEGAGRVIPAGSNIYKTSDGMWDVLAGSPVAGVKGAKEKEYRQGLVDITPEDIGAVPSNGDISDNIATFTSNDVGPDGDAAIYTVEKLKTGESISSIFQKISRMFTNIRYILNLLGNTDISDYGDGTVTGNIGSLNTSMTGLKSAIETMDLNSRKAVTKYVTFMLSDISALNEAVQGLTGVKKVTAFMECFQKSMWCIGIWCVDSAASIGLIMPSNANLPMVTYYGFELYYDANNYEILKVMKDSNSDAISFAYQAKIGFAGDTTEARCVLLIEY